MEKLVIEKRDGACPHSQPQRSRARESAVVGNGGCPLRSSRKGRVGCERCARSSSPAPAATSRRGRISRHSSASRRLATKRRVALTPERLRHLFELLLGHPKLTVAAVHGAAVAGGCGLATACDLVVAEPGARFAYTEVKIGFLAAMVLTFLTRRVAGHVARRMLLDPGNGRWRKGSRARSGGRACG